MNDRHPAWLKYEKVLLDYLQTEHSEAEVEHNVNLPGTLSGVDRQIDVLVRERLPGDTVTTAFEAKCYKRRVNVKNVEEAIGLFRDVSVDRGVVVTTVGYSDAALQRAYADDVEIELDILNLADLGQFQSDGGALPYAGSHGVAIPAPLGWVVDGSRHPSSPARLFRRGLTFAEAVQGAEFVYVAFWTKDEKAATAEELIELQNANLRLNFPEVDLTVEPLELGTRWTGPGLIRTARKAYPWLEITACVEFDQFLFFAVLHTPQLVASRNRRKLEYVVRKALPFTIRFEGSRRAGEEPPSEGTGGRAS